MVGILKKNNYLDAVKDISLRNAARADKSVSSNNRDVSAPKIVTCTNANQKSGGNRFDYASIQQLMNNLKKSSSASGSGVTQQYARSSSRPKDYVGQAAQANKLSAMLGRPSTMNPAGTTRSSGNKNVSGTNSLGNLGYSRAPNFHPRPSKLSYKLGQESKDLPQATVISASHR